MNESRCRINGNGLDIAELHFRVRGEICPALFEVLCLQVFLHHPGGSVQPLLIAAEFFNVASGEQLPAVLDRFPQWCQHLGFHQDWYLIAVKAKKRGGLIRIESSRESADVKGIEELTG